MTREQPRKEKGQPDGGQFSHKQPAASVADERIALGADTSIELFDISFPSRSETSDYERERAPEREALSLLCEADAASAVRRRLAEASDRSDPSDRGKAGLKAIELGRLFAKRTRAHRSLAKAALDAAERYDNMSADERYELPTNQSAEYSRLSQNIKTLREMANPGEEMSYAMACLYLQSLIEHYWDDEFASDAAGPDGQPRYLEEMREQHWGDDYPVNPESLAREAVSQMPLHRI